MLYFSVLWMLKYSIRWRPPMLGLRCSCQDCGAHAKIVVLMPRLRCSCQDWGAHAEIEVLKSPQSWPEHRNLGMSTSNSAWAPQSKHSNYLCIWGRHHQLDYLTRPRKSSWPTNYVQAGRIAKGGLEVLTTISSPSGVRASILVSSNKIYIQILLCKCVQIECCSEPHPPWIFVESETH